VASACRLAQGVAVSLTDRIDAAEKDCQNELRSWALAFYAQVKPGLFSAATGHVTSATAAAQAALEALEALAARAETSFNVGKTTEARDQDPAASGTVPQTIFVSRGADAEASATPPVDAAKVTTTERAYTQESADLHPATDAELENWTAPMASTGKNVLDYSLSVRKHVSVATRSRTHASEAPRPANPERHPQNFSSPLESSGLDKENAHVETTPLNGINPASMLRPRRSNESMGAVQHRKEDAKSSADSMLLEKNRELTAILQQYEATLEKLIENESQSQTCSMRSKLLALETENNQLKADLLTCTEAFEQLSARYRDLKDKFSVAQSNEQRATATAQMVTDRMDEMERYLREFKQHAEQKLAQAFQQVSQSKNEITAKEAMIASLEKALGTKRTECEEKDAAIAEAMNMYRLAERDHELQRARLSALENEMQALRDRAQTAESELEVLRSEFAVGGPQATLNIAANPLRQQLIELESALAASRAQGEDHLREMKRLANENQTLKARTYDHLQEIESLRTALAASKHSSNAAPSLEAAELERLRAENEELHQLCTTLLEKLEAVEADPKT
jgi:predicted  nucleic acid-binding Zn-ribbon protein